MSARPPSRPRTRLGAARAADLLLGAAVALALVGAALVVWRPAPRVPALSATLPPPPPPAPAAPLGDPALQDAVVRTNVFAATRTPPRVRWAPPGDPDSAAAVDPMALAPQPAPAPRPPRGPDDPPQFYGTIVGPDGPRALLRLDGRVPGAQLYAVGEGEGGWRVVRVEPERVVLTAAGERVTLHLPRPGARRAADGVADTAAVPRTPPDSSDPRGAPLP